MDETKTSSELNRTLGDLWDSLTDEQRARARACRSMDELVLLASKVRIELPDEMLEAVAGGKDTDPNSHYIFCPYCSQRQNVDKCGTATITRPHCEGTFNVEKYKCRKRNNHFYLDRKNKMYYNQDGMKLCDYHRYDEDKGC